MLKVTDKVSSNYLWKVNSRKEVMDKINSKSYFIKPDGTIMFSVTTTTNDIVMKVLTGA